MIVLGYRMDRFCGYMGNQWINHCIRTDAPSLKLCGSTYYKCASDFKEKVLQLQNKPVGRIDESRNVLVDRVMDVPMKWAGQQKNVPESITIGRIIC